MSACTSPSSTLTELERQYILLTQNGLPIKAQPYHWIAEQLNISVEHVFELTNRFIERGIIRRIAAVPNHYKLGYTQNGMTVWDIKDEFASEFGDAVGKLPFVSHCYLRPRHLPTWNYNLFAMVHGKTPEEIQEKRQQIYALLEEVLETRSLLHSTTPNTVDAEQSPEGKTMKNNDMLTSTQILKKTGLRLKNKTTEKA